VVLLGLVFVTVLPVRSYLQQRRDVSRAEAALAALEADNRALQERVAELGTNEALEELARARLNLVHEGEEAFALLPPQFPTDLPTIFPYPLARRLLEPEG
jgi:cell division protein FtsB